MRLPEEQRESRGWQGRTLAVCAIAMAAVFACAAPAQEPGAKHNTGASAAATTKPATNGNTQDVEALKRLIEQKMREQGLNPAVPTHRNANAHPAQTRPAGPAGLMPHRAYLSKQALPTSRPVHTRPAAGKPVSSCHAPPGQVDLTPPAADQPQPHWTVEQDTIEAPPVWKGKKVDYVFHAKNTGEGVLNIKLKGG